MMARRPRPRPTLRRTRTAIHEQAHAQHVGGRPMTTPSTRVLIVDDSEKTRDTLIELLRFDDIEVVGESTFGAAAYTWADRLDVDVVVMTIEEPVARSLRTIEAMMTGARTWPVVGVSSRGERETMR